MEDQEDELYFRRFPAEKQDSIRALVSYITLLNLDGKDLISIGGRLDRLKIKREVSRNRAIVAEMDLRLVGKDTSMNSRWAYVSPDGTRYIFDAADWYDVRVRNPKTGVTRTMMIHDHYQIGRRVASIHHRYLADVMLNVHYGFIKLDF